MPDLVRAAFLQSMLAHRHVSDKQGRALYEGACEVAKSEYEYRPSSIKELEADISLSDGIHRPV